MSDQTVRELNENELRILKLNNLRLSIMDAQIDEALFSGMLIETSDNDRGMAIKQKLQEVQLAQQLLERKLALVEAKHGEKRQDHDS